MFAIIIRKISNLQTYLKITMFDIYAVVNELAKIKLQWPYHIINHKKALLI